MHKHSMRIVPLSGTLTLSIYNVAPYLLPHCFGFSLSFTVCIGGVCVGIAPEVGLGYAVERTNFNFYGNVYLHRQTTTITTMRHCPH